MLDLLKCLLHVRFGLPKRRSFASVSFYSQDLANKRCIPCHKETEPLSEEQSKKLLTELHTNWKIIDGKKLQRKYKMKDFVHAIKFFNKVKCIAEEEDHHPDLHLIGYKNVVVEYYTHTIGNLSENDFICASKVDKIDEKPKKLELYSFYASSCSYRVRIALALKGVSYDYKSINLKKEENCSENFIKINPSRSLPVLVADGVPIIQSVAIFDFLEEYYPDPPLFPHHFSSRIMAETLVGLICDIQPLQNLANLRRIYKDDKANKEEWARSAIQNGLQKIEPLLQKSAGKFCIGNDVSIADCFLVPQVHNAIGFGINIEQFPTIHSIYNTMINLDAVKAATPSAQPDAV